MNKLKACAKIVVFVTETHSDNVLTFDICDIILIFPIISHALV